jgi:hypothetical protein
MKRINCIRSVGTYALALLIAALWCGGQSAFAQVPASITIEAQPIEGATARADTAAITKRLSEAANAQASKSLGKGPLGTRGVALSGIIRLPLSLPPRVIGLRAHDRKGTFVSAQFTLRDAHGKSLSEQTVTLRWKDVNWLTGSPKWRRNRAVDEVLEDATRRAVNRALKQLAMHHVL